MLPGGQVATPETIEEFSRLPWLHFARDYAVGEPAHAPCGVGGNGAMRRPEANRERVASAPIDQPPVPDDVLRGPYGRNL